MPDLFAGQPLVIHGRYRRPGAGALVLEGRLRGRREILRRAVTLPAYAADNEALGRLWARARVDRLTRETYGQPHPDTVAAITDLGLRFHLMTPYTSLVAVDSVISNRGGSQPVQVPVEMPAGVSYEGIFGRERGDIAAAPAQSFGVARAAPGIVSWPADPPPPPSPPHAGFVDRDARENARRGDASSAAGAPGAEPRAAGPSPAFVQVVLVEEDGTRRTIEEDGEAWFADTTTRRLARTLTAERIADLRSALAAAGVDRWQAGEATWARGRSRLVVVFPGGITRSVALPSGEAAIRLLAEFVRAATT